MHLTIAHTALAAAFERIGKGKMCKLVARCQLHQELSFSIRMFFFLSIGRCSMKDSAPLELRKEHLTDV
jgi:hypothetical protein